MVALELLRTLVNSGQHHEYAPRSEALRRRAGGHGGVYDNLFLRCREEVQVMQRLYPPLGRVGNERKRVSGEGGWNTDRAASHPPRRLVPRLRPSRREGKLHYAMEGAIRTKKRCR